MRVDNWPQVLAAKVEEWRRRPFKYGAWDCFQLAADSTLALTGVDYRERFPLYKSRQAAYAILKETGGPAGLLTSVLGEPKPIAQAMRGDVVVGDFGDGEAAGICIGVRCVAPGAMGLVFIPTANATAAWGV